VSALNAHGLRAALVSIAAGLWSAPGKLVAQK